MFEKLKSDLPGWMARGEGREPGVGLERSGGHEVSCGMASI